MFLSFFAAKTVRRYSFQQSTKTSDVNSLRLGNFYQLVLPWPVSDTTLVLSEVGGFRHCALRLTIQRPLSPLFFEPAFCVIVWIILWSVFLFPHPAYIGRALSLFLSGLALSRNFLSRSWLVSKTPTDNSLSHRSQACGISLSAGRYSPTPPLFFFSQLFM